MSNHLAIAAVSATLKAIVVSAIKNQEDVSNVSVKLSRPEPAPPSDPTVYVYLYQATPNAALRNSDLPSRDGDAALRTRPQAALDLHYLISFAGSETDLAPQRLMGIVARALHSRPVLSPALIRESIADYTYLKDKSDLADAVERVRVTREPLSNDDLSRIWSMFYQVPYLPSLAYVASVVLIEEEVPAREALPVREAGIWAFPLSHPVIEKAVAEHGPIESGGVLRILGRNLAASSMTVRVGHAEVTPAAVTEREIRLRLGPPLFPPGSLRAGVQGVQVVHWLDLKSESEGPAGARRAAASNVHPIVLRPRVTSQEYVPPDSSGWGAVKVGVEPPVAKGQRIALLLNRAGGRSDESYSFLAEPAAAALEFVPVPVKGVRPGAYVVRIQVDGAASAVNLEDPESTDYGPKVTIT